MSHDKSAGIMKSAERDKYGERVYNTSGHLVDIYIHILLHGTTVSEERRLSIVRDFFCGILLHLFPIRSTVLGVTSISSRAIYLNTKLLLRSTCARLNFAHAHILNSECL